eukprot:364036-Chlamydomonas_euryale.AAC.5
MPWWGRNGDLTCRGGGGRRPDRLGQGRGAIWHAVAGQGGGLTCRGGGRRRDDRTALNTPATFEIVERPAAPPITTAAAAAPAAAPAAGHGPSLRRAPPTQAAAAPRASTGGSFASKRGGGARMRMRSSRDSTSSNVGLRMHARARVCERPVGYFLGCPEQLCNPGSPGVHARHVDLTRRPGAFM